MNRLLKFWYVLALISFLPFIIACGGGGDSGSNPIAPTSTYLGNISGKIAGDGDLSGIPVYLVQTDAQVTPAASVRPAASEQTTLRTSLTDSNGVFLFSQVPEGTYNIIAQRNQFQSSIFRNISVSASVAQPTDLVLRLTATGELTGTVTVPTGYSASGIVVYISGTSYAAYTDQNGNFTITGIPVGDYSVDFSGTGLVKVTKTGISVTSGNKTTVPQAAMLKDPSYNSAIIWKGSLDSAPADPSENWAYRNTTDNKAYIYINGSWQILIEGRENEKPVISNVIFHRSNGITQGFRNIRAEIVSEPFTPVVTIFWQTNESTIGKVEYGPTTAYGKSIILNESYSIYHSAKISDLTSGTIYYRITATDISGNETVSQSMSGTVKSWSQLTNAGRNINCSVIDASGNLYVGGNFTEIGGVSANKIAKFNGTTWSALGDGVDGEVNCITADAAGNIYAGGNMNNAGAVPTFKIAKWNPTTNTWSALGTGLSDSAKCITIGKNGEVFVGGYFTQAGGNDAKYIAVWNPGTNTWSPLGDGLSDSALCMAVDSTGKLYVGGEFTTAGGNSANYIASWNGSTWSSLGLGLDGVVNCLAIDANNNLYAGGNYTAPVGSLVESENRIIGIARWSAGQWERLTGPSVAPAVATSLRMAPRVSSSNFVLGNIISMTFDSNGNLYAGGFSNLDIIQGHIGKWNGQTWTIANEFNGDIQNLRISGNNLLAFGYFNTIDGLANNYIAGSSL